MKRFILAGLTTLTVTFAIAPVAIAKPVSFNPYTAANNPTSRIAPSDLVSMAQRGKLKEQGIPSNMGLTSKYTLGRIGAEEIVQSAISAGLLPTDAASDRGYLNAVEAQMRILVKVY